MSDQLFVRYCSHPDGHDSRECPDRKLTRDQRYNASKKGKRRTKRAESSEYRKGYRAGYKAGKRAAEKAGVTNG